MDFENFLIGAETGNPLQVTTFGDGALLIQDNEGERILINEDQLTELIDKLRKEA